MHSFSLASSGVLLQLVLLQLITDRYLPSSLAYDTTLLMMDEFQQVDHDLSRTVLVTTKLDTKLPQFGSGEDLEDFLR